MMIKPGLVNEITITVEAEHTAASVADKSEIGRLAPVLSTPYLVGLMETTAHGAILPFLTTDQSGVGSMINMKHMAATPVGMQVRVQAELLEVEGRRLLFKIEAWDEVEKIAEGEHERYIINWDRFMESVKKKSVG
jgi:predicted thioesterase